MFMNSPPFTAWDVHYPVFSGTIYEQKHMFLPLYNHTKLCHLELDFKCRVFQLKLGDIWSQDALKPIAHEKKIFGL